MNRVNTSENNKPPTTTIPNGTRLEEDTPRLNAIGKAPNVVARLVIKIGRKRWPEASNTASRLFKPFSLFLLANSTINIPFFVTSPISMIIPIFEKMFNVWSNIYKLNNAPANASGTVNIIMNGSIKLSNCAASIK